MLSCCVLFSVLCIMYYVFVFCIFSPYPGPYPWCLLINRDRTPMPSVFVKEPGDNVFKPKIPAGPDNLPVLVASMSSLDLRQSYTMSAGRLDGTLA